MKSAPSFSFRFNGPVAKPHPSPVQAAGTRQRARARHVQGLQISGLNPGFEAGAWVALANEAMPDGTPLVGLSNELGVIGGDGWAIIPYGDHPNERGLQPFGRAEAERMVGYFKNTWNSIKRAFVGMPVYRGHPDMAKTVRVELQREKDPAKRAGLQALINTIERRYPDKTVYGTITDLEARDTGLALRVVLTEEGAALVNEQGLGSFSPHWLGIAGAPSPDGKPTQRPIFLVSIGLTDRPNIPGTSLVNDQPDFPAMNHKLLLIQLLAAMGRPLANEASEEQIAAAQAAAIAAAPGLLARPEATALVNEQGRVTQLTGELGTANIALANERAAHEATRKARNELLVVAAIQAGRITEAQKPVWLGRLERDFAGESVALANEQGAVKTRARTDGVGARKPGNSASDQFTALVNERVAKGENWTAAWEAVKGTTEGKALYDEMNKAPAVA